MWGSWILLRWLLKWCCLCLVGCGFFFPASARLPTSSAIWKYIWLTTPSHSSPDVVCWYCRMSLQILNAENGENVSDDLTAEECGFYFALPEPTERPSILRLSQKENLPPKSVAKAMKVKFCFHAEYILLWSTVLNICGIQSLKIFWYSCPSFFLPLPSCPFLKGNLSNSSKRSSVSKNIKSYHDRQTWFYFHAWRLQWSLAGWSIYAHQHCVSNVFTACSISNVEHNQVNFPPL